MAISLIASGEYKAATTNGYTTGAFDVGSPSLIVVWLAYQGSTNPTLSDNKGNTYTTVDPVSTAAVGSYKYVRAFYAWSSVTGGSDLTFTVAGSGISAALFWQSYSGTRTSSDPYVTKTDAGNNYGSGPYTIIQPGAITATSGNLLTIGLNDWIEEETGPTINSGFTRLNFIDYSDVYAGADAYKISTGTSDNPTWTSLTTQDLHHTMMIEFAAAAGGGGSVVKTYDGTAVASVKTLDGTAYASRKTTDGVA
jgi:hypothetical protein